MNENRLNFYIPPYCPKCHAIMNVVSLGVDIRASYEHGGVTLHKGIWRCSHCRHEKPVGRRYSGEEVFFSDYQMKQLNRSAYRHNLLGEDIMFAEDNQGETA